MERLFKGGVVAPCATESGYLSGRGLLLLVLSGVGIFFAYLYWLHLGEEGRESRASTAAAGKELRRLPPRPGEQHSGESETQFTFDFFSMLPQEEYAGMERHESPRPTLPSLKSTPTKSSVPETKAAVSPATRGTYMIQLGAFGSRDAADRHRAELLLQGVTNVQIESARDAQGQVFRVNVGPFQSFSVAERQQAELKQSGYDSFLKKYSSPSR